VGVATAVATCNANDIATVVTVGATRLTLVTPTAVQLAVVVVVIIFCVAGLISPVHVSPIYITFTSASIETATPVVVW
jgi:hypothetical protein